MKITFLIITLLTFLMSCSQTEGASTDSTFDLPMDMASIEVLLDSIYQEDQKYRAELENIGEEFGWDSEEMQEQWKKIAKTDSSNLVFVEKILEKHGWLGSDDIGYGGNSTLFLVIQHSNQETQEKYLPMMRKAVDNGKANSRDLALLEDRLSLGRGDLQVYGSQVGTDPKTGEMFVLPLIDPDNVNERRAEVGLSTIETYISTWDLEWDVDEYKKKLPRWIEILESYSSE